MARQDPATTAIEVTGGRQLRGWIAAGRDPADDGDRAALERALMTGLHPLARAWRQALAQALAGSGLSGAAGWALLFVGADEDGVRQIDLAADLDINPASLVRLIDALAGLGLVERHLDAVDRRVRRVRLTQAGHVATVAVERTVATLRSEALADVADGDLTVALRVARRIGRSIDGRRRR